MLLHDVHNEHPTFLQTGAFRPKRTKTADEVSSQDVCTLYARDWSFGQELDTHHGKKTQQQTYEENVLTRFFRMSEREAECGSELSDGGDCICAFEDNTKEGSRVKSVFREKLWGKTRARSVSEGHVKSGKSSESDATSTAIASETGSTTGEDAVSTSESDRGSVDSSKIVDSPHDRAPQIEQCVEAGRDGSKLRNKYETSGQTDTSDDEVLLWSPETDPSVRSISILQAYKPQDPITPPSTTARSHLQDQNTLQRTGAKRVSFWDEKVERAEPSCRNDTLFEQPKTVTDTIMEKPHDHNPAHERWMRDVRIRSAQTKPHRSCSLIPLLGYLNHPWTICYHTVNKSTLNHTRERAMRLVACHFAVHIFSGSQFGAWFWSGIRLGTVVVKNGGSCSSHLHVCYLVFDIYLVLCVKNSHKCMIVAP